VGGRIGLVPANRLLFAMIALACENHFCNVSND